MEVRVKYEASDLLSSQEITSAIQKFKREPPYIKLVEGQQDLYDGNWKILGVGKILTLENCGVINILSGKLWS
jgi:hypothetical protein